MLAAGRVSAAVVLAALVLGGTCLPQGTERGFGQSADPDVTGGLPAAVGSSQYEQAVMPDQPVALWRLDDSNGSNVGDSSGQGQTGAAVGGVSFGVTGALGTDPDSAAAFDGQSGYIRGNNSVSVGPDFTIEAWVKADSATESAPLVSLFDGKATRTLFLDGRQFRGMTDMSSNWPNYAVVSSVIDPTSWHHVVFTVQGGATLALFVDGESSATAKVPAAAPFSAAPVLGWSDANWLARFAGSLDEIALYAGVLPTDRIKSHYTAAGRPAPSPCATSLQSRIDAAPAGSVLQLPACVYRETVTVTKPLTLDGQSQAEIRGSDVWTQWSQTDSGWISTLSVPDLGSDSNQAVYVDQFRASSLEQVFMDGAALMRVANHPNASQFALDNTRHVLLGANPAGHIVEVTTRSRWLVTVADNVTVENMGFHHAASPSQAGAINNDGHSGWTLQSNVLTDAHGGILALGRGAPKVLNNILARGGQLAIQGFQADGAIIRGNTVSDSGNGGWDPGWAGGGIKFAYLKNLTIDGNVVHDNGGPGIWCDILCDGVVISNNRVFNQTINPIFYEVSTNAQIFGNSVWDSSGWGGIVVSSSGHVDVHDNVLAHTPALRAQLDNRERPGDAGTSVRIHDNRLVSPAQNEATSWWQMAPNSNGNVDSNNVTVQGSDAQRIIETLQNTVQQVPHV